MKRFFDIVLTSLAVLVLSPLLVPIMIILKLTGEHYIFYCQERVGKGGKSFGLMKFATMLKDSPNIGTGDITTRHDPRVLPFGRFLRKTKINELPQLFNILKGDMSIIGPRPLTPRNFAYYSPEIQQAIGELRPGLSGIGSVIFRDEERYLSGAKNPADFYREFIAPYKGALEIWYRSHASLWVDFTIIFLTAWVIVFPKSELPYRWFRDLPPRPEWMAGK